MKPEKWISCLVGISLAFLLSFGSLACLASGFDMDVSMTSLALGCGMAALFGGCYLLKRGDAILACLGALVLGWLWRRGTLVSSFETLLFVISKRYDSGYGWGVIGAWSGTVTVSLLIFGVLIALVTVRTVCRRSTSFPAMTLALIPLLLCMVLTDTVPAGRYLAMLLAGMLLVLLTGSLRRVDPGQANMLTGMALIPVVLVLGLLFWVAPREGYENKTEKLQETLVLWAASVPELWEELTTDEEVVAEHDDSLQRVDLSNQGPRRLFTYAVMDVYTETGGVLYLRERDYDSYSGTGWVNSLGRSETFARNENLAWEHAGVVIITTKRVRNVLFYPYYPGERLTLVGGCVGNIEETDNYVLDRYVLPDNWRQLTAENETGGLMFPVAEAGAVDLQRYSKLPADTKKWAETLLPGILGQAKTDTEIAEAIAAYVRNCADYDLNTPRMDDNAEDFARWFLEESDTGYCVHFATAAAVLLRAAGVEARYVTGYMVQTQADGTVTVTADRAHAWVEYYESALDTWIVLEATPAVAGDVGDPAQTTETTQPDSTGPEASQPDTDPTETESQTGTGATEPGETETPVDLEDSGNFRWIWWILLPVAALAAQYGIRRTLRRRRIRVRNANRRGLALWQEVVLRCRLLKQHPPRELETLAQKAKFSQHTLSAQELLLFESWLREAGRQLAGKPWYWRLLWKCLYAI